MKPKPESAEAPAQSSSARHAFGDCHFSPELGLGVAAFLQASTVALKAKAKEVFGSDGTHFGMLVQAGRGALIDMTVSIQIGGPSCGCPYHNSPTILGVYVGSPDFWKLPCAGRWGERRLAGRRATDQSACSTHFGIEQGDPSLPGTLDTLGCWYGTQSKLP